MLYCLSKPFEVMVKMIPDAQTRYIEIVDEALHALNRKRVLKLKELAKTLNLEYSVHSPFADLNIASPSKDMLQATLKRMKASIENAALLEARTWVFHSGIRTGISYFYPGAEWKQNLETTRTLIKIGKDVDVNIALENTPEPFPFYLKRVDEFRTFLAELGEDLDLVLDVGHANICGETELYIKTFGRKIVHMHISDNDGTADQHQGIGYGTVDWNAFTRAVKASSFNGTLVVESTENVRESVQKLTKWFA